MMSQSFYIVLFEFDQIFPGRPPRAGAGKFAVRIFQKKFGRIFLKRQTPAGVVADAINAHARAERMGGVGQLLQN